MAFGTLLWRNLHVWGAWEFLYQRSRTDFWWWCCQCRMHPRVVRGLPCVGEMPGSKYWVSKATQRRMLIILHARNLCSTAEEFDRTRHPRRRKRRATRVDRRALAAYLMPTVLDSGRVATRHMCDERVSYSIAEYNTSHTRCDLLSQTAHAHQPQQAAELWRSSHLRVEAVCSSRYSRSYAQCGALVKSFSLILQNSPSRTGLF